MFPNIRKYEAFAIWRDMIRLSHLISLSLSLLGLSSAILEPSNFDISPLTNQSTTLRQYEPVRRFACPVGFFRLKRFCYYLSAGTAPWREAYFHCKDRNATLAILDRNGKDKMLRKYLMGEQFSEYKTILSSSDHFSSSYCVIQYFAQIYKSQQRNWSDGSAESTTGNR